MLKNFHPAMKRIKKGATKPELSFYEALPTWDLNYEEFKARATDRLRLLRKIENNVKDLTLLGTAENDLTAHFCLRLLCAQTKWSSIWFINLETLLFKTRMSKEPHETLQFFLNKVWPYLNLRSSIDYDTFYSLQHHNTAEFDGNIKVHFTRCSEVMAKRTHDMKLGYFEMSQEIMESFLASEFRRVLEKNMGILHERTVAEADERLIRLNRELLSQETPSQISSSTDIQGSSAMFPLCIKGIIQKLQSEKHLKYGDRQVLCRFFKDVGISLTDCVEYFRSNFKCTPEQFNKEYMYSIRHNYGLEGRRANYGCFSCNKIIGSFNDSNSFGCPFVKNHGFVKANADIEDLGWDAVRCCSQVWAKTVGKELEKPFYSPADYFKLLYKETNKQIQ